MASSLPHLLLLVSAAFAAFAGVGSAARVHVVFMNHLDVGYNGIPAIGYINNVLNRYFDVHFPQALRLIAAMQQLGYRERFRYTTHPWLLDLYLNCPQLALNNVTLSCPNATMVAAMKRAMVEGSVLWHAGPMNMQLENMDATLLEATLNMSRSLDRLYQPYKRTRVLSQRDVPGMTNQVIGTLLRNGVTAVTVGVNAGSYPPEVTREPFVWSDGQKEIVGIWHPGGYPNDPGDSPANPGGISVRDCAMVSGVPEILCFSFRSDNQGPPQSPGEVLNTYDILRDEFPGAEIVASSLEDFVYAVLPYKPLMQVVKTEIGDTWIQGIASDPKKMADYRALSRAYTRCHAAGDCPPSDPAVWASLRYLIKPPEHTWGLPSPPDSLNYANEMFHAVKKSASYVEKEKAWIEQRQFNSLAYAAAKGSRLQAYMDDELRQLKPEVPSTKGFIKEAFLPSARFTCRGFTFSFFDDGSLDLLQFDGLDFASSVDRLGRFVYRTYNEIDDGRLVLSYGNPGYGKPNVTKNANPMSQPWPLKVVQQFRTADSCSFVLVLQLVDREAFTDYGAPEFVHVAFNFTNAQVDIDTVMVNKTTTRIEEAIFFEFRVPAQTRQRLGCRWWLRKLDGYVDPLRVTYGGSVLQHAVNDHALLRCLPGQVQIRSPDVPLACPFNARVEASPFPYLDRLTDVDGVSFNIYNNLWNTNYIFWYPFLQEDANFKARFSIKFSK